MQQQPVPHTDLRKAGLAAALVVGLLLAAGLAVVALTRRPHALPVVPGSKPSGPSPEVTPDIANVGIITKAARVQFADKKDPGRAAGMIEWASLEPVSPVEKLLTEPRGYVYLRDGGLVIVTSKSGRLNTTPKVEEPQSGRFEGGVTLKLYPAGTDPKADAPTLTATSDSLDFDLPSASLATTGPFSLRSTAFDIDGSGMRLIVNQVEEGIERFEVAHVKQVLIRPDARDPLQSRGLTGTQTARATPNARSGSGPDRLRTYRAVVEGAVRLTQAGRTMTADRVESWANVINNRLPAGAIGRFGPDPMLVGSCPDTGEENNAVLSAVPDAPKKVAVTPPPATSPVDGPDTTIKGTWTGRMVLAPVTEKNENAIPPEFGDNKVALRLHAGSEPVTVEDDAFKGTMTAARVDFGATNRTLTLASSPSIPVKITTASAGSLESAGAAVNLGTGKIDLAGPGVLKPAPGSLAKAAPTAAAKPGDAPATTLNFNNTLTLNFKPVGNFITPDARSASIKGGFTATSGEVKASADEATVIFAPRVNDKNAIQELRLSGNAVASAPAATTASTLNPAGAPAKPAAPGARDTLKGQQMTFKFEPDQTTGQEQPKSIEVTGSAEATAGGTGENGLNLKARTITAQLAKDAKGQIAVVSAEAKEEVHVSDNAANGAPTLSAAADRLTVDPATGIADMYGMPVTVARDGAVMTGGHLHLTQAAGEVTADGPGTISFIKEGDPAKHEETTYALASWSKSMTFNNTTGTAVCVGDASATMSIGDTQRNTLQASTVNLNFTPAPKPGEKGVQRELTSAEAVGELGVDGKPPHPATLERRMFAAAGGEQKLQQLIYLEGSKIIADQQKRTLDVPVAGKLLVDDRTPDAAKPEAAPAPAAQISPMGGFTSAKGTSLFTWAGSLHLSMIDGKAELKRDVSLIHQPLAQAGQPAPTQTTLDCDQLTAFLKTDPTASAAAPMGKLDATLERVEATGNVIVKSAANQVTAYSLRYDTVKQIMEAAGKEGTDQLLATFLDPSRPAPLRARRFIWNQQSGEFRIIEPAPTTIGQ